MTSPRGTDGAESGEERGEASSHGWTSERDVVVLGDSRLRGGSASAARRLGVARPSAQRMALERATELYEPLRRNPSALAGVARAMDSSSAVMNLVGPGVEVTGQHADTIERLRGLSEVLEVIKPVIAADGGSLDLLAVDVVTGVVRLQLSGACGSCAVSASTLNDGVNRIIKSRLEWVTEVAGVVEESDVGGLGGWTPKHS